MIEKIPPKGVSFSNFICTFQRLVTIFACFVSVSAMLVDTLSKNIAQVFILERYFFVSILLLSGKTPKSIKSLPEVP